MGSQILVYGIDLDTGFMSPLRVSTDGIVSVDISSIANGVLFQPGIVSGNTADSAVVEYGNTKITVADFGGSGNKNSDVFKSYNARSLLVSGLLTLTNVQNVTITLQGDFSSSFANPQTILASAVMGATGYMPVMRISPQLTAVANVIAKDIIYPYYRLSVTTASTNWLFTPSIALSMS